MAQTETGENLKILFIGDIVGSTGLKHVCKVLSTLRETVPYDVCIANGENVSEGKGIVARDADDLFNAGVHVITTGNHVWDKWQARHLLAENERILRPHNYPRSNPGSGVYILKMLNGIKIGVINVQGRTYMQTIDCPFRCVDNALPNIERETSIILVDMHAEATAEKVAMGWYLDGRVSAVVGTHTHIPTADARVLPGGTAYITDLGMSGPYDDSVVGLKKDIAIRRFLTQTPHKYEVSDGPARLSGVVITVNVKTGRALSIKRVTVPEF